MLRRYVVGASSEEERRRVEAWGLESAERRRYLHALLQLRGRTPHGRAEEGVAAWARVAAQLERPDHRETERFVAPWEAPAMAVRTRRSGPPRVLLGAFGVRRRIWPLPLTAAAVLLIGGIGFRLVGEGARPAPGVPAATMRRVATTRGQRAEISLDDGTRVVLGVDSRLEFPSDFETGRRDVYLNGTAYFHVMHNAAKPFTVHTANAVTRDVGTQFVVRAYPGDRQTEVVVSDGSVAMGPRHESPDAETVLTRDERGVVTTGAPGITVSRVDPAEYTGWMRGQLMFADTPLSEVVRELGRWYDTDVTIGDASLERLPFSASFTAESFREVVRTLTTVLPVRAVRRGIGVVLYRR